MAHPEVGWTVPPPWVSSEAIARGDQRNLRYRLMTTMGVHGVGGDGLHPYGGLEFGGTHGRFGAMALAQYGNGNGFRSILVGGGPAVEVVDLDFASLIAYGGLGWYQEELETPRVSRELSGPFGGLSLRIPLPLGAVGGGFSIWRGSMSGDGVLENISVTEHRFWIGFGF